MNPRILTYLIALAGCMAFGPPVLAATIKGKVTDDSGETLTGSHIVVQELSGVFGVAGLDGSFSIQGIKPGTYTVSATFIGYKNIAQQIVIRGEDETITVSFVLENDITQLGEVVVSATVTPGSDTEARMLERQSASTMNVVSAKAISLSPDISVANVIQRVSGLSVERNSNGDPQYAIVRGMDKRYSYTLVNGLKIPSPDNKNRYVPLDIFPASLLERLEVYKSLTADMEGDAIGGGVNMVMKSAPEVFEIKGDVQLGYNYINVQEGFDQYNSKVVSQQSPRDIYGAGYLAQPADFTKKNLEVNNITPLPDMLASLSMGNRFLHDKLGIMLGGSFQNAYRGTKSLWFDYDTDRYGYNLPSLRSMQDRHYSTQQIRGAGHARLDYAFDERNSVKLYSGYYTLINHEARQITDTYLDGRAYDSENGNAILQYSTRTKNTDQTIFTNSLTGTHKLFAPLSLLWSGAYSIATNDQPDNARFIRNGELVNFVEQPQNVERRNPRQWLSNKDTDFSGYANLTFQREGWGKSFVKAGAMLRRKDRNSNFNLYYLDPDPSLQVQGEDWNTYSDVTWKVVNPAGSTANEMNYTAHENIDAAYMLGNLEAGSLFVNAGLRLEHTNQGYHLKYPKDNQAPDSSQNYTDLLPSVSARYKLSSRMNLRFTYYRGISRPGFFEIVPYQMDDDGYKDYGNPALKRVRADNVDLRLETFQNSSDQLLVGVFYKHIMDPIEYAIVRTGITNDPVLQPNNFGAANNMGIEADFIHYFGMFGIRANYTYTHSSITTTKVLRTRADEEDPSSELVLKEVNQTRALQGQADHIGNFSLLYKNARKGWESQLSMVYTGERLEAISPYLDNDIYARPIVILDFSLEKRISNAFEVFLKANNLLNSTYEMYVKKPVYTEGNTTYPHQDDPDNKTLVRRDQYYQSFRLGLRYQFNKAE